MLDRHAVEEERRVSRETCVEITVKVPLPDNVNMDQALRTAKKYACIAALADGTELHAVAILADGRRLQVGEDKIREWVGT